MDMIDALSLNLTKNRVFSFVGSGGKTTLLFLLARAAQARGLRAAVFTTTHIARPDSAAGLCTLADASAAQITNAFDRGELVVCGCPCEEGKLSQPREQIVSYLIANADAVFIEADGSRRLPLKFPGAQEPVLLPQTDCVIAVAGLCALNQPLAACCHRFALAQETLGFSADQTAGPQEIAALLTAGYLRYHPLVLLNQADTPMALLQGRQTGALLRQAGFSAIAICSRNRKEIIRC